jgi:hypothetical protein
MPKLSEHEYGIKRRLDALAVELKQHGYTPASARRRLKDIHPSWDYTDFDLPSIWADHELVDYIVTGVFTGVNFRY